MRAPTKPGSSRGLKRVPYTLGFVCDPAGDRAALIALYRATDGDRWYENYNWLSNDPFKPLDAWHGVTTDGRGRVIELKLDGNRLSGTIPPDLGRLADLTSLDLSHNDLSGQIPSEIGSLANLNVLTLGNNQLDGHIPSEIGKLSKLEELRLGYNELSGELPYSLAQLEALSEFYFGDNGDLCAPGDTRFRGWLGPVRLHVGPWSAASRRTSATQPFWSHSTTPPMALAGTTRPIGSAANR